jgi:hypothetical protein
LAGGSREQRNKMAGARAQRGKDAVYAGCKLEPLANARSGGALLVKVFRLGDFGLLLFSFRGRLSSLLFLVWSQRLLSETRAF